MDNHPSADDAPAELSPGATTTADAVTVTGTLLSAKEAAMSAVMTPRPIRIRLLDEVVDAHVQWDTRSGLLTMIWPDGEAEVLNVDLSIYGYTPGIGECFVKDWSEHEGLVESLVAACVVSWAESFAIGPFNSKAYRVVPMVHAMQEVVR